MLMFVTHYGSSWLLYPHPHLWRGGYIAITLSVRSHFRNRYLSFSWKKWFYIWYMAWWLVPCLPFPGLPHNYFLFTVRLTNERVGVFLARRSVQHLDFFRINKLECILLLKVHIHNNKIFLYLLSFYLL
jgi:hypothetical protein